MNYTFKLVVLFLIGIGTAYSSDSGLEENLIKALVEKKFYEAQSIVDNNKIDLNKKGSDGKSLLDRALMEGNFDNIYFSLNNGSMYNEDTVSEVLSIGKQDVKIFVINDMFYNKEKFFNIKDLNGKIGRFLIELYKKDLPVLSRLVLYPMSMEERKKRKLVPNIYPLVEKIIYNQKGYDEGVLLPGSVTYNSISYDVGSSINIKEGFTICDTSTGKKPLFVKEDIPIGYNIYLPKGPVKGTIISVYGAHRSEQRIEHMWKPDILGVSPILKSLLQESYAIIQLNLLDFLYSNDFVQMPYEVHQQLHSSIDTFFQTIKNRPNELHKDLGPLLISKDIFLYGDSFGGRTAIRHAELYPHTFNGYISQSGYINYETEKLNPIKFGSKRIYGENICDNWLSPTDLDRESPNGDKKIKNIQNPCLIIQNEDDNNVSLKTATDFYEKVIKAGKQNLVRMLFIPQGGSIYEKPVNKGHFVTDNFEYFERLRGTVLDFIEKKDSFMISVSKWQAKKNAIYSNKITVFQEFFSEIYRDFSQRSRMQGLFKDGAIEKTINDDWNRHLYPIYSTIVKIRSLRKQEEPSVREEIKQLSPLLCDRTIKNALERQLPNFFDFIKEKYGLSIPLDRWMDFSEDKNFQATYKEILDGNSFDIDSMIYLLRFLYLTNSNLLNEARNYPMEDSIKEQSISKIKEEARNLQDIFRELKSKMDLLK